MKLKLCPCGAVLKAQGTDCGQCGRGKQKPQRNTTQAGYGWDWQQIRDRYIKEHPLCLECLTRGIATPADEVHHIVAIEDAPWLRLEWNNLMALCVPCHRAMDEARRQGGAV
jgi:5-methylcytosine-specific restriction protein A